MIRERQLIVLSGDNDWLKNQISIFYTMSVCAKKGVYFFHKESIPLLQDKICHCPFQLAKNILGQENDWIIFDVRRGFNLDALAIAEGTLKAGGVLFILTNNWAEFSHQLDYDSQRWADGTLVSPTHFFTFFKDKIKQYKFPVLEQHDLNDKVQVSSLLIKSAELIIKENKHPTSEQQYVLNKILQKKHNIFVVTAKRGRGKSALAGLLTQKLLTENKQQLLVTAPNKKSIQILQQFSNIDIPFIAPDTLLEQLESKCSQLIADYLIIDEAAMIPLPLLKKFIHYFNYVVCTTTVQSYEGTGRGFILKFMQKINRPFCHFELIKSLRWIENDPLELFIEDLLFLTEFKNLNDSIEQDKPIRLEFYGQERLIKENLLEKFYQLLTVAHYRTSPSDLRRLFDGLNERFFLANQGNHFLGGIWAILEGNIQDKTLIKAIQRGQRKPRGNLVAQLLTQYTNLDDACTLKSARISRIAVQPSLQGKGIGQQLVMSFCEQLKEQQELDFISVSFGYEDNLMNFWKKCGFQLAYLSDSQIASSGCYSVVALYGLTKAGKYFIQQANKLFQRNLPLIKHPLVNKLKAYNNEFKIDYALNNDDITALYNFADYHRPFFSSIPSILRLLAHDQSLQHSVLKEYFVDPTTIKNYVSYKQWLYLCRQEIQKKLIYSFHN